MTRPHPGRALQPAYELPAPESLDPISTQQVYTAQGLTSGRWSRLIDADVVVNIHGIPIYSFSGWMLINGYAASFLVLGRWWYERSGCGVWVGADASLMLFGELQQRDLDGVLERAPWTGQTYDLGVDLVSTLDQCGAFSTIAA